MIDGLEPGWLWAIGGVLLLIAEIIAPGFFLVFVGAAAIATGIFTLLFDLGTAPQLALFAIYAVLAVMIGKRWYGEPHGGDQRHAINQPAKRLVGKTVTAVTEIDDHGGRVKVGDGEWNARGGPAAAGDRLTVTDVEGNCLIVEPVKALPSM
ncbi:NfeD family protein [Sphingomonas sp. RB56-2]|uniref:NfeD family protein n=1 Tax=Sphingomonas brevis TaxID=2908206 RepID=A0ABT0S6R5_9SPHN|nr:NfeD family protein [Sphingomonas brevis]MCL6740094.1 NfeD family protein [Sphingomonas brevis]